MSFRFFHNESQHPESSLKEGSPMKLMPKQFNSNIAEQISPPLEQVRCRAYEL
jgi:hypothetical protein